MIDFQVNAELREIATILIAEQVREDDPGFMNDLNYLRNIQNRTAMTTTTTTTATTPGVADANVASNLSLDQSYKFRQSSCHILPQSDYVWDQNGERTCNYVLRYEHLEAEFNALAHRYHTDLSIANSTIKHMFPHDFDVADVAEDVKELFGQIYEADFCSLGYSRDNISYVPPPMLANA